MVGTGFGDMRTRTWSPLKSSCLCTQSSDCAHTWPYLQMQVILGYLRGISTAEVYLRQCTSAQREPMHTPHTTQVTPTQSKAQVQTTRVDNNGSASEISDTAHTTTV